MKKIIELAEKICNGNWVIPDDNVEQMRKALAEYKRLSETPITEDWLKEHGWLQNGTTQEVLESCDWENCDDTWCHPTSDVSIYIDYPTNKILFSQDDGQEIWLKNSLANLYDALELCGITIES